jgi:hypothetical protein
MNDENLLQWLKKGRQYPASSYRLAGALDENQKNIDQRIQLTLKKSDAETILKLMQLHLKYADTMNLPPADENVMSDVAYRLGRLIRKAA